MASFSQQSSAMWPATWLMRLTEFRQTLQALASRLAPYGYTRRKQIAPAPELKDVFGPVVKKMLDDLHFKGVPAPREGAPEKVMARMRERAAEVGWPLEGRMSRGGFETAFNMGGLAFPNCSIEVQSYIVVFTWLVIQVDDAVQNFRSDVALFHQRWGRNEPQPHPVLQGLADLLHEAPQHWDPVMANLLVTTTLNFINANVIESSPELAAFKPTFNAGREFPYWLRDISGIPMAYAIFMFPSEGYPDVGAFLEAFPDLNKFINLANDVISFWKEEKAGETRNYISLRAQAEGKPALEVMQAVAEETVACADRVEAILSKEGREPYYQVWRSFLDGYMSFHLTSRRYKLDVLGLERQSPLPRIFE